MISATAAKRLRWGRFDEESPYLSLPYGSPEDGQYFGPASIGGPPGSRSGRGSYKARNSTAEIVERLQQNLQNDLNHESSTDNDPTTSVNDLSRESSRGNDPTTGVSYNSEQANTAVRIFSEPNLKDKHKDGNIYTKSLSLNSICAYEEATSTAESGQLFSRPRDGHQQRTGVSENLGGGLKPDYKGHNRLSTINAYSKNQVHSKINDTVSKAFTGNNSHGPVLSKPLSPPPQLSVPEPTPHKFEDLKTLGDEECREALLQYISYKCCFSEQPANQLSIKHVKHVRILHYTLESFGEGRTTKMAYDAYTGGEVDGPKGGESPAPWSLSCLPDIHFFNHTKTTEVPHTSSIKICFGCCGRGKAVCGPCNSSGTHVCTKCDGHRRRPGKIGVCSYCSGRGDVSCSSCGGDGFVTCDVCSGGGHLRYYQQVAVVFTNHREDYAVEPEDLPEAVLKQLRPPLVFEQKLPQVWPLSAYPVPKIAEASDHMVMSHRSKFPSEKLLQQRQQLWAETVCEVVAESQGKDLKFWIYGKDNRVYCPDYPRKYGICTIL